MGKRVPGPGWRSWFSKKFPLQSQPALITSNGHDAKIKLFFSWILNPKAVCGQEHDKQQYSLSLKSCYALILQQERFLARAGLELLDSWAVHTADLEPRCKFKEMLRFLDHEGKTKQSCPICGKAKSLFIYLFFKPELAIQTKRLRGASIYQSHLILEDYTDLNVNLLHCFCLNGSSGRAYTPTCAII